MRVQENSGNLGAFEDVLQIAVGVVELLELALQFVVERLQFFFGSLQFLIRGLQLFIHGEELFVGRLELFIGSFQFLDGGLQILFGGAQFIFELLHDGILGFNCLFFDNEVWFADSRNQLLKEHNEKPGFFAQFRERSHHKINGPQLRANLHHDVVADSFPLCRNSAMNGGAQFQTQAAPRHIDDLVAGHARSRFEKPAGAARKVNDLSLFVDDDTSRRVFFEQDPFNGSDDILLFAAADGRRRAQDRLKASDAPRLHHWHLDLGAQHGGLPLKDAVLFVDGAEQFTATGNVFGRSQKKEAGGIERIVKYREQFALQIRFEVNQQIAAGNEVLPGKGRVFDQIMRRENAHFANFGDDFES